VWRGRVLVFELSSGNGREVSVARMVRKGRSGGGGEKDKGEER